MHWYFSSYIWRTNTEICEKKYLQKLLIGEFSKVLFALLPDFLIQKFIYLVLLNYKSGTFESVQSELPGDLVEVQKFW